MTQAAGGQQKWEALPEATKAEKHAKMVENVVQELEKGVFDTLSTVRSARTWTWTRTTSDRVQKVRSRVGPGPNPVFFI